jgi:hypothetical protein
MSQRGRLQDLMTTKIVAYSHEHVGGHEPPSMVSDAKDQKFVVT